MHAKHATLYRMVLPDHVCPFGERAKAMLLEQGYEVDDCILTTREEVDAFKAAHGLDTTPFIVIGGEPILGSEELAAYLLRQVGEGATEARAFCW